LKTLFANPIRYHSILPSDLKKEDLADRHRGIGAGVAYTQRCTNDLLIFDDYEDLIPQKKPPDWLFLADRF